MISTSSGPGPRQTEAQPKVLPFSSAVERRDQMLAVVRRNMFTSVDELRALFGVSSVTVRADLDELSRHEDVHRVRGGAVARTYRMGEVSYSERQTEATDQKRRIAAAAVEMLSDDESVIIDGGTTTMEIAREITVRGRPQNLLVFTNALNIALELGTARQNLQVVLTGGTLRSDQQSLVEPMAGLILRQISVSVSFMGCSGIDVDGSVTTTMLAEREIKRQMITAAERAVLVVDSNKLGMRSLVTFADIKEFSTVVTAGVPDDRFVELLGKEGVEIRIA